MTTNRKALLSIVSCACLLTGCTSDEPSSNKYKAKWQMSEYIELTRSDKEAMDGINEFSHQLMTKASEIAGDEQFNVSPVSISILLGMLANGSAGELHSQIMAALGSDDVSALNSVCEKLMHYLPCDENGSSLAIENNIWVAKHNKVSSSFVSTMRNVFNAGVEKVDFRKESTVNKINKWVSQSTNGKIPTVLDNSWENYKDMEMIGVNTVYFKGDWAHYFNPDNTKLETFHTIKEDITVPMMHNRLVADFAYDDMVDVVYIPFENSHNYMYLYLPTEGMLLSQLTEYLTPSKQKELREKSTDYRIVMSMPSFRDESNITLDELLKAVGITKLTDADMSPMGLGNIGLKTLQKSSIKVDETGAELAVVTEVEEMVTANLNPTTKEVTIDFNRPFLYMIKNPATDAILIAGTVTDPR